MSTFWDGVNDAMLLSDRVLKVRMDIADAARDYAWDRLLRIVAQHPDLVNSTRPGGPSLYAPLHQAAHGGASIDVIEHLVRAGAWRTHQNTRGERPVDVAVRQGHTHLVTVLAPRLLQNVPIGVLLMIQRHFQSVIRARAADHQLDISGLRLPELEPILEQPPGGEQFRFYMPGMYGGFNYWLSADGVEAKLVSETWSRVVGGSGQRHEITSAGATLVAEGFV